VHDGINAEQLGKPAATILTRSFEPLAKAVRKSLGMDRFGLVVVPHPLGNREQMTVRVRDALPQILRVLTSVEAMSLDTAHAKKRG
jgi:hypothetical protein